MPQFRMLSPEEAEDVFKKPEKRDAGNTRQAIRQQYRDYLRGVEPGQALVAEIQAGESKTLVRKRLLSAAKDLGYQLEFKRNRNPGELPFRRLA